MIIESVWILMNRSMYMYSTSTVWWHNCFVYSRILKILSKLWGAWGGGGGWGGYTVLLLGNISKIFWNTAVK